MYSKRIYRSLIGSKHWATLKHARMMTVDDSMMSEKAMPDESIVEKIRKLLALADGNANSNEHEREVAMRFALDLLAKHNLTVAQVDGQSLDIQIEEFTADFKLDPWVRSVLHAACTLYYTRFYISSYYDWWAETRKKVPVFVGTAENIEVTVEMAHRLMHSIRLESNRMYRTDYERRSFRLGAAYAVFKRAEDMVDAERQCSAASSGTTLTVVRNQLERANEEWMEKKNLGTYRSRATYFDPDAYDDGTVYGGTVQLGTDGKKLRRLTVGG